MNSIVDGRLSWTNSKIIMRINPYLGRGLCTPNNNQNILFKINNLLYSEYNKLGSSLSRKEELRIENYGYWR